MHMYTRNEFCKLTGISNQTLRHYVKIGLLKPSGQMENGYNLYTTVDALKILETRFFGFGLSLAEISERMNTITSDREAYKRRIAEEIFQLETKLGEIQKNLDCFKLHQHNFSMVYDREMDTPYLAMDDEPVILAYYDGTPQGSDCVETLVSFLPSSYTVATFAPSEKGEEECKVGIGAPLSLCPSLADQEGFEVVSGPELRMSLWAPDLSQLQSENFDRLFHCAQEHGFTIKSDAICSVCPIAQVDDHLSAYVSARLFEEL